MEGSKADKLARKTRPSSRSPQPSGSSSPHRPKWSWAWSSDDEESEEPRQQVIKPFHSKPSDNKEAVKPESSKKMSSPDVVDPHSQISNGKGSPKAKKSPPPSLLSKDDTDNSRLESSNPPVEKTKSSEDSNAKEPNGSDRATPWLGDLRVQSNEDGGKKQSYSASMQNMRPAGGGMSRKGDKPALGSSKSDGPEEEDMNAGMFSRSQSSPDDGNQNIKSRKAVEKEPSVPESPKSNSPFGRTSSIPHGTMAPAVHVGEMFSRLSSTIGFLPPANAAPVPIKVTPFLKKFGFSGPEGLDNLLGALDIHCDNIERTALLDSFMCPVCDGTGAASTTTADQIRAVHDAFRLIDADGDGKITLTDLRDIASWTADGDGMFINNLIAMLNQRGLVSSDLEDLTPISAKDFLLAFARCLSPGENDDVEQIMDKRSAEYRKIGTLFGMEKVQQHFAWSKFWLTFFSDSLAFIAFPLCKFLDLKPHGEEDVTLHDILTENQWLPIPYTSYDAFQYYLMKLWAPSLWSLVLYAIFIKDMQHISIMEVSSSMMIYCIIGTYIATISGYEHPRLVLRRLNSALSGDMKQNELRAIFAFRAHTPEGHAVDQIGTVADTLFANKFRWISNNAAALAGWIHGLMPILHRIFWVRTAHSEDPDTCMDTSGISIFSKIWFWVFGGHGWIHPLVSVPATCVSGYLTYRLVFITSVSFYNDLAFYYRLLLFRATTQAEPFLRYRARWIKAMNRQKQTFKGRNDFLQYLNLQKQDDLLLWCRIRQLLCESYTGFKNKQGDVMVSFMLISVLTYAIYIFAFQLGRETKYLTVFDLRARMDVFVFSLLLIFIVNLKLSIHGLRKADISMLHREYYYASMNLNSAMIDAEHEHQGKPRNLPPSSKLAAHFIRRKSNSNLTGGSAGSDGASSPLPPMDSPANQRGSPVLRLSSAPDASEVAAFMAQNSMRQADSPPPDEDRRQGSRGGGANRPQQVKSFAGSTPFPVGSDMPANLKATLGVQHLLDQTARYIQEFDKPPRLLSFTVSIHFLRYMILPLLSPIFAALARYTGFKK